MRSMTGYGDAVGVNDRWKIQAQIHSVNHKRLDAYVYMPSFAKAYEAPIRKRLAERVGRGKVNVEVRVDSNDGSRGEWHINRGLVEAALAYAEEQAVLKRERDLRDILEALKLEDAMSMEMHRFTDEDGALLLSVFEDALEAYLASSVREGAVLKESFVERLAACRKEVAILAEVAPRANQSLEEKLRGRLMEVLADGAYDERRLMEEMVYFANRMSIDEELVRMHAHLDKISALIEAEGPIGRECDFYFQEMNREINTSGSKINDVEGSAAVVQLKVLLEQMREQIQNVV